MTSRAAGARQGPRSARPGLCATRGRAGAGSQSARKVGGGSARGQALQPGERTGEFLGAGTRGSSLRISPGFVGQGFLMI